MKNKLLPITFAMLGSFAVQANEQLPVDMLDIKSQANERWFELTGQYGDVNNIKTKRLKDGSILVTNTPGAVKAMAFDTYDTGEPGATGSQFQLVVETPDKATAGELQQIQAGSWGMQAHHCFSRYEGSTGWIDSCYKVHKLSGDGDSNYDYFQLEHYATAKGKSIWGLTRATLEASKASSSDSMQWVDWNPRADLDVGNCSTVSLQVTAQAVGISTSHNICDKWDITKYSTPGHFKNEWKSSSSAQRSEREVAYMIAVKVAQGGWPVWSLTHNYDTRLL
ncbi:hypothetical protein SG34_016980 [Thalassomonas viridans]|uniref:Uncharacterized protein n=1 Tax=Thalassomonas viridans TaxID=137584 RepID=A0AAF0C7R1_9GAMM|nr:hypothetical protein [Thalassomonas viridans]WDE03104.1 hypothetical protein SG34_016980 [Thalassomonas viridans]